MGTNGGPTRGGLFLLAVTTIVRTISGRRSLLHVSITATNGSRHLNNRRTPPTVVSVFLNRRLAGLLASITGNDQRGGARHIGVGINARVVPRFGGSGTSQGHASPFTFANGGFRFEVLNSTSSVSSAGIVVGAVITSIFGACTSHLRNTTSVSARIDLVIGSTVSGRGHVVFGNSNCSTR